MGDKRKESINDRCDDGFWEKLPGRLLHPTQMQIIEAMRWIGHPLSATDLERVFDKTLAVPGISYHIRRLSDLSILEFVRSRQRRGAYEKFYWIASETSK